MGVLSLSLSIVYSREVRPYFRVGTRGPIPALNLVYLCTQLWAYFGFLDKKVPKCYLSGSDF